jgi:DNA invertase Pin-like site-specific DNA recombinase
MNAIYLRVSTQKQGQSGLGLEAQRAAIAAAGWQGREFVEVESGRKDARPQLQAAIEFARSNGGAVVFHRLDRLTRSLSMFVTIRGCGVKIVCLDTPDFNDITAGIMAVVAEKEGQKIRERTKAALDVKRAKCGEWRISQLTSTDRLRGSATTRRNALVNGNNQRAYAFAKMLKEQGHRVAEISRRLNTATFRTATNKNFTSTQVNRLLIRYGAAAW